MRGADRVRTERGHEIEAGRIRARQWKKRQIASIRQHRNGHPVYCQRCPPIADVAEYEARITGLDERIRRRILHVNTQSTFDEWNRGQCRRAGGRGRWRADGRRGACAKRHEKRDAGRASRDWLTQHEVKLTVLPEGGEPVMVCRASPSFLYCRGTRSGGGEPPGGIVTTQPPETSILYAHPRSTCSPTS